MLSIRSLFSSTTCRCRVVSVQKLYSTEPKPEEDVFEEKKVEEKKVHYDPKSIPKPLDHRLRGDPYDFKRQEKFVLPGVADYSYNRLYDYYKIGEIVDSLPSLEEKIAFVNPYERPWKRDEKKWHREFMSPLHAPRKAYSVPVLPKYFDTLDFYGYITKTDLLKGGTAQYYKDIHLPTTNFEEKVKNSILTVLKEEDVESFEKLNKDAIDRLLKRILDDALSSLPEQKHKFAELRVSHNPRCESFWIKAGFGHLYKVQKIDEVVTNRRLMRKIPGDHRQKLGELAFTCRDEFAVNVRSKTPLKPLVKSVPSEKETVPLHLLNEPLNPMVYNLWPDEEPLWQCPNYEPESGETHRLAQVAFKNTLDMRKRFEMWEMDQDEQEETHKDLYKSMAITSLFNWNNGQAHCQGFTQYNDLKKPFTSQLVLSNGKEFSFAVGQLNTLAINVECNGFINDKVNYVTVDEPLNLFESIENGQFTHKDSEGNEKPGLNESVLQNILRTIVV
ncbi:unnamed protein product [Bursaphelenchus okinawaensis]|uniref:28S ribosomal protein S30, mitochondrial n=1 Tax=Bursaphelenchus okinawaensis TaxID=465554 RepID=A0A811JVV7_9BILA|nr:unnamed protein product [Bursaphelenchus okinawaensis]CAG9085334.1 unnamed protein product [Bursaphelenchus okinawaensis]